MRYFLILSLILLILFSGCTAQVVDTGKTAEPTQTEPVQSQHSLPKPQLTTTGDATQEAEITTRTAVDVIKTPEEPMQQEPKIFNVNVVQGIGVAEGAG